MFARLPRSPVRPRLSVIVRRLILVAASLLIAYYVLSTILSALSQENQSQSTEQSRPPDSR